MTIKTQLDLLNNRRTKIVATIGPSSAHASTISALIDAGVNIFRLNMSHGNHGDHEKSYLKIREAATKHKRAIAIFADLCGPKIRTGSFEGDSIELTPDGTVTITTRDVLGNPELIPSQYKALANDVNPDDRILLDDGKLELQVQSVEGDEIGCKVIHGGQLNNNKGINLPGVEISSPSLTDKDKLDAEFALGLGVDFLALSFVRSQEDVKQLREIIDQHRSSAGIISKFEKPEALSNASKIIKASDAIMVARGDLGVELSPEQVPVVQTKLISLSRRLKRPVIVATQMLESMMTSTRPSRAEVSDISQAVATGVDAVMLSGETAAGMHPVQTAEMMARIIRQTEAYLCSEDGFSQLHQDPSSNKGSDDYGLAIAQAAADLAKQVNARAILSLSQSGMSATSISAVRPAALLLAVSSDESTYRRLNLQWGTLPILADEAGSTHPNVLAKKIAQESGIASKSDYIVLVRGFSAKHELNTPSVTLLTI